MTEQISPTPFPGADNRFLWIAEQALESLRTEGWRQVKGGWGAMLHNPSCEGSAPQVPCRHPQDTYRQLYKDIKVQPVNGPCWGGAATAEFWRWENAVTRPSWYLQAKQWDLPTKSEVEDMATYLGLDLEQDAALMWLAQQARSQILPHAYIPADRQCVVFTSASNDRRPSSRLCQLGGQSLKMSTGEPNHTWGD